MEIDRRQMLSGLLASAGHAVLARAAGAQAASPAKPYRIDIHHHFAPPAWVTEVKGRPLLQPANTAWTPARSIEDMDRGGVAAAMVSITNPGLWFGDAPMTRRLARACNDYGATLVRDHPARFGLFAAMPLPDVDGTLREIEYAFDTLKADGIGLFTSYGDRWLGHADFRPVMEELHRRKAVVHVHPTAANCCRNLEYGVAPAASSTAPTRRARSPAWHSAATLRSSPTSVSSGRTRAARRRSWRRASTVRPATPRSGCRPASWRR